MSVIAYKAHNSSKSNDLNKHVESVSFCQFIVSKQMGEKNRLNGDYLSRWWIGTEESVPKRPFTRPTISCTSLASFIYSSTVVRVGTAICIKRTFSLLSWASMHHSLPLLCLKFIRLSIYQTINSKFYQLGLSSRNFSKARSFCGMPLMMSSRSTPSSTVFPLNLSCRAPILWITDSVFRDVENRSRSIPIGNAATLMVFPLSSTPSGVPV